MTRDEYNVILATEPATANQVGAAMGEFERLGFGLADRRERLAVAVALLRLDELRSTWDLTMGQAGRLVGLLRQIPDRAALDTELAAAGDEGQAEHVVSQGEAGEGVSLAAALARLAVVCAESWRPLQVRPGVATTGPEGSG